MLTFTISVLYSVTYLSIGFDIIPKMPIACHLSNSPSMYQLNHTIDCQNLLNRRTERYRQNATLFKLNLNKYNTKVWSCQKLRRTDVVYKSFGPIYKLKEKISSVFITVQQCQRMVETKLCPDGESSHIINQHAEDIWSTNLTSTIKPKTFQVRSYNVTNCVLTTGSLWINRLTGKLESSLGTVVHCHYGDGYCNMNDHRHLIWNPNPEAKCSFLKWKTVFGYFENNVWYSKDEEPLTLTFVKNPSTITDECGQRFYKSLQGMGIMFDDIRKKRNTYGIAFGKILLLDLGSWNSFSETAGFNPVTQAELSMKLQGIISQLLMSPDVNGLSATCSMAQEIAYGWFSELYKNPTMVIRRILRTPYVKAEIRGRAIFIWTCNVIDSFSILPMNSVCTDYVPISFNYTQPDGSSSELLGYLNPSTNEILSSSSETNCDQLGPLILELNETFYW